jgi:L-asparaginase
MQAMAKESAQKVVILGTGGTIAGRASNQTDNLGYTAAQIGVAQLLAAVPGLRGCAQGCDIEAVQIAQIDSKDMSYALWRDLALAVQQHVARPEVRGLVVTHGTDTLEETAYFLQALLAPQKPVVLTCAMRPATSLQADGPQNICDAVSTAAQPGAQGVLAVCAGVLHAAQDVQKMHTYALDAFSSGEAGPIGYVRENRVLLKRNWPDAGVNRTYDAIEYIASDKPWPRVEMVQSHAGASGATVRALVRDGVQGLVVAGTGNGTVHSNLEVALLAAQAQGVQVLRSTRCALGQVMTKPGDALAASELTPVKARIALMLQLMAPGT